MPVLPVKKPQETGITGSPTSLSSGGVVVEIRQANAHSNWLRRLRWPNPNASTGAGRR
jgi:hypothetical protein